jgi:DNA-binding NarL/FixJ family response regulator
MLAACHAEGIAGAMTAPLSRTTADPLGRSARIDVACSMLGGVMKVLVAADHHLRQRLAPILAGLCGAASVRLVGSLAQLLADLTERPASDIDLVLVDVALPELQGFAGVERLIEEHDVPVVVIAPTADRKAMLSAISSGARGCVPAACDPATLWSALLSVDAGELCIPDLPALSC